MCVCVCPCIMAMMHVWTVMWGTSLRSPRRKRLDDKVDKSMYSMCLRRHHVADGGGAPRRVTFSNMSHYAACVHGCDDLMSDEMLTSSPLDVFWLGGETKHHLYVMRILCTATNAG